VLTQFTLTQVSVQVAEKSYGRFLSDFQPPA
jgi:hypothetical protein